jgi:hypothetical protein
MPPILDNFPHSKVEVLRLLEDEEVDPSHDIRAIVPAMVLDEENLLPQALVRVNDEESLADGDENGQVKDRVRR